MNGNTQTTERIGTKLTCGECGHSHVIDGREVGHHTDTCLVCGTNNPGFKRETVRR